MRLIIYQTFTTLTTVTDNDRLLVIGSISNSSNIGGGFSAFLVQTNIASLVTVNKEMAYIAYEYVRAVIYMNLV